MYDDIATVLAAAGIPAGQLLDVMTMLDSFVIGSALDIAAPDQARDPAPDLTGHPHGPGRRRAGTRLVIVRASHTSRRRWTRIATASTATGQSR